MGYVNTEQMVRVIEATSNAIATVKEPQPVETTNYWWLLIIGVVPVIIGFVLQQWRKRR